MSEIFYLLVIKERNILMEITQMYASVLTVILLIVKIPMKFSTKKIIIYFCNETQYVPKLDTQNTILYFTRKILTKYNIIHTT